MTERSRRKTAGETRRTRRKRAAAKAPIIADGEPSAEFGFGTRAAAMFAECGLDEPIPELRGYYVEPMKFEE